jgi:hypothetical protein
MHPNSNSTARAQPPYVITTPLDQLPGVARELVEHGPLSLNQDPFPLAPRTRTQLISEQKSLERELQIIDHRLAAIDLELAALPEPSFCP